MGPKKQASVTYQCYIKYTHPKGTKVEVNECNLWNISLEECNSTPVHRHITDSSNLKGGTRMQIVNVYRESAILSLKYTFYNSYYNNVEDKFRGG